MTGHTMLAMIIALFYLWVADRIVMTTVHHLTGWCIYLPPWRRREGGS